MRSVCVYCGANPGVDPAFAAAAAQVGGLIAVSGRTLVYGGAAVGLMGVLADAALAGGGQVVGVIPRSLIPKEIAHRGLSQLHVVESMHERKALIADLSDCFLGLPGGIGTLEEFLETWTWGQLGLHHKPYGLLNVSGFFNPLLRFLDHLVEQGFVRREHREMLLVSQDASDLLDRMAAHRPTYTPKWIGRENS